MSKWLKLLAKIRQNPKNVRYEDVELVLIRLGFQMRQGSTSHVVFTLEAYRILVPRPHGSPFVGEVYIVKEFLPTLERMGIFGED